MNKTMEQMVQELYTVMLGIPGTSEKGACQKITEIERHLREINGEVQKNTAWRKAFVWLIGFIITFLGIITGMVFGL